MCIQSMSENVGNSLPGELQLTSRSQMSMVDGEQNLQGLSLSLSTQMSTAVSTSPFQYQYTSPGVGLSSVLSPHLPLSAENNVRPMSCKVDEASPNKDIRNSDYFAYEIQGEGHNNSNNNNNIRFGVLNNPQYSINQKAMYQYEQAGMSSTLNKSKYLKAAQLLLDEVVNVRDALKRSDSGKEQSPRKVDEGSKESKGGSQAASEANESGSSSQELSPAERQELQNKLDKLHSMLDEVDRRYKQYCQQMQILVSSFDVVAGAGAAKPYTTLALKTISRHFRCLRDAITNQIQATRKILGEQDNGPGGVIPRLRYVDQQLRQQRALQQFGMMRHAWRPQRGLPESAVTILRAWLFEHFLHPYPKDSEKIMLARQTGLTRSQVANWFINARVRLWKPMVEEMYKEEFGEAELMNSRCSPENTPKLAREKSWGSEDRREEMQESSTSIAHDAHDSKVNVNQGIGALGNGNDSHGFYSNNGTLSSPDPNGGGHGHGHGHGHSHLMVNPAAYQISEMGSFSVDNQVSLALGLRHREGDVTFRGNTTTEANMGVATSDYNPYLEQVNQQHRFGNPSHILNDFVA
ncbi:hypothetical protein SOVF_159000 [Spinacia oleracea]|nr:hypothetical protein SOVF_159000 [Spinacia oleracea]